MTRGKLISASSLRLRRRSAFERAVRNNQFSFSILPVTFRCAASTSLRARFARQEFIQTLLAEASRFANAPRRFKAAFRLVGAVESPSSPARRSATLVVCDNACTTWHANDLRDLAPGCWIQTLLSSYLFMTPGFTFLAGISLLALFGWYFATSRARLKRILGTILTVLLVAFCVTTLYPPDKTIRLGLDLQGGTSFLIRLSPEGERSISADTLDQAVEVIRKRVDQFGVSEPVITPQGADRILVQIPGLAPEQIAAARLQLAQVAKLEFRLVHPENDRLIAQVREGTDLVPAGYRVETQKVISEEPRDQRGAPGESAP